MTRSKAFWFTTLILFLLAACANNANPIAPIQTAIPQLIAQVQPTPAPTPAAVAGQVLPQAITSEPLAVVTTLPVDKAQEVAVSKETARLIVQFNHPVVALTSVEMQKDLPQPLNLQPPLPGSGQWINTSTFAYTPSQNLAVATVYTATLQTLKDRLGQSLTGYSWSFKTASPAVLKVVPADNTQFASPTQPITMTFNTEMDRPSTESRFILKRQDTGAPVAGKFEWQGVQLRFVPSTRLEYGKQYVALLQAGAQDTNRVAATLKDLTSSFRAVPAPGVALTAPSDNDQKAVLNDGFRIDFSSPMSRESLKVTIAPTITHPTFRWEGKKEGEDTTVRINGGWLASQSYTVTISAESLTRYGEKLGKEVAIHFKAAPLAPSVYMNVPGPVSMYDAHGPQTIVATYVNVNRIDYKLYRVDRTEFIGLLGQDYQRALDKFTPNEANRLRAWSLTPQAPLNANRLITTTLTSDGAPLAAGVYYLQTTAPSAKSTSRHVMVVSDWNLAFKRTETEALVWATSLKTGKPVADVPLALYAAKGAPVASGKTDKDGVWRAQFARRDPWEILYVLSETKNQIVGAVGSDWNSGIMTWDFNMPSQPSAQEYYANVYTDRAIYRPGQSVFFKGILRRDNDAQYSLPQGLETVPVKVRDAEGRQIFAQNVTLNRFGTFSGQVKLSEAASIGFYNLGIELGTEPRKFFSSAGFQVAEYRRPEYQVAVQTEKPDFINGDKIKVDVTATYFFGGAVSDAPVTWRVLSDDLFFSPDTIKGYWDFADYDLSVERVRQGGVLREGKAKTDASGKLHFEVPADLKDLPLSQNWTIEAEVTDINNQAVSSRTVVPVHKASFYIGLRPQRYVGTAGQEQVIDAITVDTKGMTVTQKALTVSFYEHQWYSVREKREDGNLYWKSAYTDTLVSKVNVTSDAQGYAAARYTPAKGGIFKIVAESKDAANNPVRSATYQWVSGREFVNWRIENNDRIDLVADKKQYAVGETAEVLIPAPFKDAEALLTIERGTIRQVLRLTLQGNSERVKIPITSDFAPNVFVSILLVKGRGADSPTPQFKIGYTNLAVSTAEKQLKITLTPDKKTNYAPGEKAGFIITAVDSKDKPVEAELSLALVDKAIQSLADDRAESPLEAFYGQRGLGVQTAASLIRSIERINQQLTPEAKGGGGGLATEPVRRDFRDTAFWKADLVTDASGRAQVSIPLPDNLTTWNLTAKGATPATLVGDARTDIVSTKDLLVRPTTPRFFVVGDKAKLEAVVNNNSDKDISADVRIEAKGLTVTGNAQQPLTIRAKDKAKVSWDTTVGPVEQVVVKFTVSGGGLQDAVEQTLPVRRPLSAETVATAGQVDTKTVEQIQLPTVIDKNAGELRVELSPSLAAASRDSLDYLDSFEYECSEQTVSKFFPNVATYLALKKLGLDRPALKSMLETNVSREIQRLYALQNQDGGWGWWSSDASRPTLTAYALLGLFNAKQAGLAVDAQVMDRAEQFLMRSFEKPVDVNAGYGYNERAFTIYVMTEIGRNYTSRAVSLFDQRANLGHYGKAYLLMALNTLKQPQAQTLVAELTAAAIQSATGAHWEEARPDYWTMNTNTRTTALAILAISRVDPKNATLANAVRWLMVARKEGHWETTQETAWSVLALTQFMQSTGELNGNYTYQATLNGKPLGDGQVSPANVDQPKTLQVAIKELVSNAANELVISRSAGEGRLYYSAALNYYLPAENIPALNKGIIVTRDYQAVDPQTLRPTGKLIQSAKVGDYVQVTLTLIAPNDLHYLVLEDPLPAGFEAVDTTLKTSSSAAASPQLSQKPTGLKEVDRWYLPYWSYWAHSEIRDDRIAAFATFLGRGSYEYSYLMRASVGGEFRTLPSRAWEMYFPEVFGRSASTLFSVQGN